MKFTLTFLLSLILFSCGRVENSSSQDKATYYPRTAGSVQHEAALAILNAKCTTCHEHTSWAAFTDADFVSTGLLIPTNPTGSQIYYRNQLGPGPQNNMPAQGGPAMTTSELQTIADWINSITP